MNDIIYTGIDVSRWQGEIDWKKVKESGIHFAFIRLGWCGYDGGIVSNGGFDPYFVKNMNGAIENGIDVGVYVYSYIKSATAAKIAAAEVLDLVAPFNLTYPIAFDIEDRMYYDMDKSLNTDICNAFMSVISEGEYVPILYTFKSFTDRFIDMSKIKHDVWIAQWGLETTYKGDYTIWQYSSTSRISGITGDVDMNYCYKDYPKYITENNLNEHEDSDTEVVPAPPVDVVTPPDQADDTMYVVKKNDNLSNIAKTFDVPLRFLIQANQTIRKSDGSVRNLTDPNLIYVGEVIVIPSKPE